MYRYFYVQEDLICITGGIGITPKQTDKTIQYGQLRGFLTM